MPETRRQMIPLPVALAGLLVTVPSLARFKRAANDFMLCYPRSFPVRSVGGRWIVHSHLPPLNGLAAILTIAVLAFRVAAVCRRDLAL
jgi:hypothetical protein